MNGAAIDHEVEDGKNTLNFNGAVVEHEVGAEQS
jgi:hypothetical protein